MNATHNALYSIMESCAVRANVPKVDISAYGAVEPTSPAGSHTKLKRLSRRYPTQGNIFAPTSATSLTTNSMYTGIAVNIKSYQSSTTCMPTPNGINGARSPRAKPSSGPPFIGNDSNNRDRTEDDEVGHNKLRRPPLEQQYNNAGGTRGSNGASSKPSSLSPSLPSLVSAPSRRKHWGTSDPTTKSIRSAWPTLAASKTPSAVDRTKPFPRESSIGSDGSEHLSSYSARRERRGHSSRESTLFSSDDGVWRETSLRETHRRAKSDLKDEESNGIISSQHPSSPTMDQCLAILSRDSDDSGTDSSPSSSARSSPMRAPSPSGSTEGGDDGVEESVRGVYQGVDDLLARPPPTINDTMAFATTNESKGHEKRKAHWSTKQLGRKDVVSCSNSLPNNEREDHNGRAVTGLRKVGSVEVAPSHSGALSPQEACDGTPAATDRSQKSFGLESKKTCSRSSSGSSTNADANDTCSLVRRKRRGNRPPKVENNPGSSDFVRGVRMRRASGSSSEYRDRDAVLSAAVPMALRMDFGGIDTTLLQEAFAFADQAARHEREEQASSSARERTADIESASARPNESFRDRQRVDRRLRRSKSMGAATNANNSVTNVSRFERGAWSKGKRVLSWSRELCNQLGGKYDNSKASTLTEDWLRGDTGAATSFLPDPPRNSILRRGLESSRPAGGNISGASWTVEEARRPMLGVEEASGSDSNGSIRDALGLRFMVKLAPRSTVMSIPSSRAIGNKEDQRKSRAGALKDSYNLYRRRGNGCNAAGRNRGKRVEEISLNIPGTNGDKSGSQQAKVEDKRALLTAELVERFETGSGLAELRAELEASQALIRRSTEAIGQAANRWHRPFPGS